MPYPRALTQETSGALRPAWTEEPGGLQSPGSRRAGHSQATRHTAQGLHLGTSSHTAQTLRLCVRDAPPGTPRFPSTASLAPPSTGSRVSLGRALLHLRKELEDGVFHRGDPVLWPRGTKTTQFPWRELAGARAWEVRRSRLKAPRSRESWGGQESGTSSHTLTPLTSSPFLKRGPCSLPADPEAHSAHRATGSERQVFARHKHVTQTAWSELSNWDRGIPPTQAVTPRLFQARHFYKILVLK